MRISIYFDVYSFTRKPEEIYPTTTPGEKPSSAIRYRVDTEIPDPAAPDKFIQAEAEVQL